MEDYIKWLENKIEQTLEDKDLQREHWAFCQSLKQYRKLNNLIKPDVMGRSELLSLDGETKLVKFKVSKMEMKVNPDDLAK